MNIASGNRLSDVVLSASSLSYDLSASELTSDSVPAFFNDSEVFNSSSGGLRNVVFSLGVVDDLSLDGDVLNSFVCPLDGLFDHDGFLDFSLDVLDLSLNSVVVGDSSFVRNSLVSDYFFVFNFFVFDGDLVDLFDLFVFNVFLFEGNVLDSALDRDVSSNGSFSLSVDLTLSDLTLSVDLTLSNLTLSVVGLSLSTICGGSSGILRNTLVFISGGGGSLGGVDLLGSSVAKVAGLLSGSNL